MADVKISALPDATVIADTDELEGSDAVTSRAYQFAATRGFKNRLLNGCFRLNQELPASNADDTYAHDGWYALTQTAAIALSTVTAAESGLPKMARLTQSQAAAQRMGYAQIIEGKDCVHLRGQTVTFRIGRYRCSAAQAIRFAVLEWTGSEDAVTSDVVLDWTSASYAANAFFLAANLTVSGVVAETPAAATLQTGPNVTVTLGTAFNNLIVFVWTEGTAAQNVTLDLGKAQLELGAAASPFERRPFSYELAWAERFYEKSYLVDTAPGSVTGAGQQVTIGQAASATQIGSNGSTLRWRTQKRGTPTVTIYAPSDGASANFDYARHGAANAKIAASQNGANAQSVLIYSTAASGMTAGAAVEMLMHYVASARL